MNVDYMRSIEIESVNREFNAKKIKMRRLAFIYLSIYLLWIKIYIICMMHEKK